MSRHVDARLQAFLDGALAPAEAASLEEHLRTCERCRAHHADIAEGRALVALLLPAPVPDAAASDAAWQRMNAALASGADASRRARTRRVRLALVALAAAALLAVIAVPAVRLARQPHWDVEAVAGAPLADGRELRERTTLRADDVVTTDASSRARLFLPGIGTIDVAPQTRVRVLDAGGARVAGLAERRLALDHGLLHARVLAPPRLLVVETPSATAIDLGCEYELAVAEDGSGVLRVLSGRVALASRGREVVVHAGEETHFGHVAPIPRPSSFD